MNKLGTIVAVTCVSATVDWKFTSKDKVCDKDLPAAGADMAAWFAVLDMLETAGGCTKFNVDFAVTASYAGTDVKVVTTTDKPVYVHANVKLLEEKEAVPLPIEPVAVTLSVNKDCVLTKDQIKVTAGTRGDAELGASVPDAVNNYTVSADPAFDTKKSTYSMTLAHVGDDMNHIRLGSLDTLTVTLDKAAKCTVTAPVIVTYNGAEYQTASGASGAFLVGSAAVLGLALLF